MTDPTFATMPLSECNRFVGSRVRQLRAERHMSQQMLAERIGINRSKISKLENAEHQFTLIGLVQLSRALDCMVADLIYDPSPSPDQKAA